MIWQGWIQRILLRTVMRATVVMAIVGGIAAEGATDDRDRSSLGIGSPAPPLDIQHWISGNARWAAPVTEFQRGRVYVVEFWATWCGPCVASIPHLAEIQKKYGCRELRVISISDEDVQTVREFLSRSVAGESLPGEEPSDEPERTFAQVANDYSVTTDPDQSVYRQYMVASGREAIPMAFIVGKTGRIEWFGGPMQMDQPLAQVIADTWDREAFARQVELEQANDEAMRRASELARQGKKRDAILALGEFLRQVDDPVIIYGLSNRIQFLAGDATPEQDVIAHAVEKMEGAVQRVPKEFHSHMYDTLARLLRLRGEVGRAITAQKQAVQGATPALRPRFDSFLQDLLEESQLE